MRNTNRSVLAAAAITAATLTSAAWAVPTIDGTRDADYGSPIALQTVNSSFGDSNNQTNSNGSELDGLYSNVDLASGKLNLFLSGNLETNNNKLVLFFDTRAGGQNTIRGDNPDVNFNNLNRRYGPQKDADGNATLPGFTFDAGFSPDYFVSISRDSGNAYVDFSELNTNGGGNGGYAGRISVPGTGVNQQGAGALIEGSASLPQITLGLNDNNIGGVTGATGTAADATAVAAVTTGTELSIDLTALGIEGDFKLLAFVNGSSHDYASNQFLTGFNVGQGSLGSDGNGNFATTLNNGEQIGTVSAINLGNYAGNQFVTIPVTLPTFTYNLDANSNYSNPAAFTPTGTLPTGASGRVIFGSKITAARTVTIDQPISLISLTFNNANAYTLAGTNAISIAGATATPAITVALGNHVISAPVTFVNDTRVDVAASSSLTISGAVTATGRNLFKQGAGTLSIPATPVNSLTVSAGTLKLTGTGNTTARGVTITTGVGGGTLDLTSSALIIDYDDGFSPREALKTAIASGAITSSTRVGSNFAIGYLDSAAQPALTSFNGTPLDATGLVFRATFKGDATLDGRVNFDDLVPLAQNYNLTGKQWYEGDFTGDGKVNFDDLVPLAQNYNLSLPASVAAIEALGGASFASDWALAQSLVPEPTSLVALASAGLMLARRRK